MKQGVFTPRDFNPVVYDLYKVNEALKNDTACVAVCPSPYIQTKLIQQQGIPKERTGVLLSVPDGKVYCMDKKSYEKFAKEEKRLLSLRRG